MRRRSEISSEEPTRPVIMAYFAEVWQGTDRTPAHAEEPVRIEEPALEVPVYW